MLYRNATNSPSDTHQLKLRFVIHTSTRNVIVFIEQWTKLFPHCIHSYTKLQIDSENIYKKKITNMWWCHTLLCISKREREWTKSENTTIIVPSICFSSLAIHYNLKARKFIELAQEKPLIKRKENLTNKWNTRYAQQVYNCAWKTARTCSIS